MKRGAALRSRNVRGGNQEKKRWKRIDGCEKSSELQAKDGKEQREERRRSTKAREGEKGKFSSHSERGGNRTLNHT